MRYCRWVYPSDGSPRFWLPECIIGAHERDPHCWCKENDETNPDKGCICPPGSEATCQRSDCGRKDAKAEVVK